MLIDNLSYESISTELVYMFDGHDDTVLATQLSTAGAPSHDLVCKIKDASKPIFKVQINNHTYSSYEIYKSFNEGFIVLDSRILDYSISQEPALLTNNKTGPSRTDIDIARANEIINACSSKLSVGSKSAASLLMRCVEDLFEKKDFSVVNQILKLIKFEDTGAHSALCLITAAKRYNNKLPFWKYARVKSFNYLKLSGYPVSELFEDI